LSSGSEQGGGGKKKKKGKLTTSQVHAKKNKVKVKQPVLEVEVVMTEKGNEKLVGQALMVREIYNKILDFVAGNAAKFPFARKW
jgi:hypothetical protein